MAELLCLQRAVHIVIHNVDPEIGHFFGRCRYAARDLGGEIVIFRSVDQNCDDARVSEQGKGLADAVRAIIQFFRDLEHSSFCFLIDAASIMKHPVHCADRNSGFLCDGLDRNFQGGRLHSIELEFLSIMT